MNTYFQIDVRPNLTDCVRLVQRSDRKIKKSESGIPRPFSGRRSRRSVRSGYAFSHAEGFGRLITSGRIIKQGRNYRYSLDIDPESDAAIVGHCHVKHSADSLLELKSKSSSRLRLGGSQSPLRGVPTTYALCTAALNLCTAVNNGFAPSRPNSALKTSASDDNIASKEATGMTRADCLICSFAAPFHHCSSSQPAGSAFLELDKEFKPESGNKQ